MPAEPNDHYSATSRWIHWLTAGLVAVNVALAWLMQSVPRDAAGLPFSLHMLFGAAVLLLTLVRLGWRTRHPWPPLPAGMKGWEKALARFTHVSFYPVLLAIPLLGWAAASARPGRNLPLELPVAQGRDVAEQFGELHGAGVLALFVLIALHVAGAIKHSYFERDGVLARMAPGVAERPKAQSEPAPRWRG